MNVVNLMSIYISASEDNSDHNALGSMGDFPTSYTCSKSIAAMASRNGGYHIDRNTSGAIVKET